MVGRWKKHPQAEQFQPWRPAPGQLLPDRFKEGSFPSDVSGNYIVHVPRWECAPNLLETTGSESLCQKGFGHSFLASEGPYFHTGKDLLGSGLNRWKTVSNSEKIACMFVSI